MRLIIHNDVCLGACRFPRLRSSIARFQPGREHLVPSEEEFMHFSSDYDPAWPETFIPVR